MLGLKIDIDDFYERIWAFKRNADRFMVSKGGSYMRFGILLSVTTAYPIANILMNGPLLSTLFPMRYKLNNQIPDRLKKMIDQQSYMWLEKEAEADQLPHSVAISSGTRPKALSTKCLRRFHTHHRDQSRIC